LKPGLERGKEFFKQQILDSPTALPEGKDEAAFSSLALVMIGEGVV